MTLVELPEHSWVRPEEGPCRRAGTHQAKVEQGPATIAEDPQPEQLRAFAALIDVVEPHIGRQWKRDVKRRDLETESPLPR